MENKCVIFIEIGSYVTFNVNNFPACIEMHVSIQFYCRFDQPFYSKNPTTNSDYVQEQQNCKFN